METPAAAVIDPQVGHPRKWQILAIMRTCLVLVVAGVGAGSTIAWFVAAAVLLAAWIAWESRARYPLLDPRLFRHLPFGLGSLTLTVSFMVMFGFFFIITQYFQFVLDHSPLSAGVRMLPFAGTMIIVAPRSPALVGRLGKRWAIVVGLAIESIGFFLLATADQETPYLLIVLSMVLLASGMATLMPAGSEAIVSSLPPSKAGVGSAMNDTTREVGGALGIAVLGTLLANGYGSAVEESTAGLPEELSELAGDSIGGAFRVAQQTGATELIEPAKDAFVNGMGNAFLATAFISLGAAAIIGLRYPAKGHEPDPVEDDFVQSATP